MKIRRDKDKDPIRRILIENGPKTALFYAIHHRKFQEVKLKIVQALIYVFRSRKY